MNITFLLRRATLLLALALPGLCWGFGLPPKNALIVTETGTGHGPDINVILPYLTSRLVAANYTVATSLGVPGTSMSGYNSVWDIRFDTALTASDITAYVTYMAGGGAAFMLGGNINCCVPRSTSIVALIAQRAEERLRLRSIRTIRKPYTRLSPDR